MPARKFWFRVQLVVFIYAVLEVSLSFLSAFVSYKIGTILLDEGNEAHHIIFHILALLIVALPIYWAIQKRRRKRQSGKRKEKTISITVPSKYILRPLLLFIVIPPLIELWGMISPNEYPKHDKMFLYWMYFIVILVGLVVMYKRPR